MERQHLFKPPRQFPLPRSRLPVPQSADQLSPANSDVSTIEVTCLSPSSTDPKTKSNGRSTWCNLTITTISPFSLRESEKNKIPTASSPSKAFLTCSRKVVPKCCPWFLSWLFQLRVSRNSNLMFSRFEHPWQWNHRHYPQNFAGARYLLWHYRRGPCSLLQTDPTSDESFQTKQRQHRRQDRLQLKKGFEPWWPDPANPRDVWDPRWWGRIHQHQVHDPNLRKLRPKLRTWLSKTIVE